jgi:ATP-dependent Clp protease ATP-binding subunit ClpA
MPKINVYLPDDLAAAVRDTGIPVSAVCQRALADAVAAADGRVTDSSESEQARNAGERLNRLTQRAQKVLSIATRAADREHRSATSADVVDGLVEEGGNLALVVLRTLDVDPADLQAESRATQNAAQREGAPSATLEEIGDRATTEALNLGHNYIGCEHLLLALIAGPQDEPTAATLRTLGLDLQSTRDAVRAAISGITYAQGQLSFTALSAPVRSILEEIRQRLSRLEQPN